MKKKLFTVALLLLPVAFVAAQQNTGRDRHTLVASLASVPQASEPKSTAAQGGRSEDINAVLAKMDEAAKNFKSAQADFEWDQYQRVVEDHDIQKGQIYFRHTKTGVDAAVKVVSPEPKQVVFKDGKLSLYQPKIDQVTEYKANASRADVESFMSLGFGASGKDLARNFGIKLEGWETVDGVRTAKLDLTPKQEKLKSSLSRVLLWLDPEKNISMKQQFFEPNGDYRLTHYTNIKVNGKVSDDVFRLKTTSNTKVVHAQ
jgi:outer membrane lipoprotein-sorting protein